MRGKIDCRSARCVPYMRSRKRSRRRRKEKEEASKGQSPRWQLNVGARGWLRCVLCSSAGARLGAALLRGATYNGQPWSLRSALRAFA